MPFSHANLAVSRAKGSPWCLKTPKKTNKTRGFPPKVAGPWVAFSTRERLGQFTAGEFDYRNPAVQMVSPLKGGRGRQAAKSREKRREAARTVKVCCRLGFLEIKKRGSCFRTGWVGGWVVGCLVGVMSIFKV